MENRLLDDLFLADVLERALDRLDSDYSRLVVLLVLHGWNPYRLSAHLGQSRPAVANHWAKFRKIVEEVVNDH